MIFSHSLTLIEAICVKFSIKNISPRFIDLIAIQLIRYKSTNSNYYDNDIHDYNPSFYPLHPYQGILNYSNPY